MACWLPITAFQALGMKAHCGEYVACHTTGPFCCGSCVGFAQIVLFLELSSPSLGQHLWAHGMFHRHALLQHAPFTHQQCVAAEA